MSGVRIRPLVEADWPAVEEIYREGIRAGNATFDPDPPTWEGFDATRSSIARLVAVREDVVLGWVAASPVSSRDVYRGVLEHSVYVATSARGRGVGSDLLAAFLDAADRAGIWTVQASVFPENPASLSLHRRAGFREVGRRERIALMTFGPWAGQWRDTILIERRRRD